MAGISRMHGDAIKIVQLYYVRAAAELGSFSRAAAALGVTQPALSHGIAALERTLGGPLFDRTTTGVTPTALAVQILPQVHSVLGSLDSLLTEARAMTRTAAEPLRVGLSPVIHPGLVRRALEAGRGQSDAGLILQEKDLANLREDLLARRLDLVLVPTIPVTCGCRRRSLGSEPLHYLFAEPGQQSGEPVELRELSEQALVMVGDVCGLATVTRRLFADAGAQLQTYPGEADSYRSVEEWARLGLGGALLPRSRFQDAAGSRPVRHNGQPVLIGYEAMWLPETPRSAAIENLLDALQATV